MPQRLCLTCEVALKLRSKLRRSCDSKNINIRRESTEGAEVARHGGFSSFQCSAWERASRRSASRRSSSVSLEIYLQLTPNCQSPAFGRNQRFAAASRRLTT